VIFWLFFTSTVNEENTASLEWLNSRGPAHLNLKVTTARRFLLMKIEQKSRVASMKRSLYVAEFYRVA